MFIYFVLAFCVEEIKGKFLSLEMVVGSFFSAASTKKQDRHFSLFIMSLHEGEYLGLCTVVNRCVCFYSIRFRHIHTIIVPYPLLQIYSTRAATNVDIECPTWKPFPPQRHIFERRTATARGLLRRPEGYEISDVSAHALG